MFRLIINIYTIHIIFDINGNAVPIAVIQFTQPHGITDKIYSG